MLSEFIDQVAMASNGCEDKLGALTELVADLCLMKVEDRVRAPGERRKLIEEEVRKYDKVHDGKCPMLGAVKGKLGWMYAFRWQITVVSWRWRRSPTGRRYCRRSGICGGDFPSAGAGRVVW